jgi:hypothetical protein
MDRFVLLLMFFAGDCLAHSGHGAPLVHAHGWDWVHWALAIGAAGAAWVIWRAK